MAVGTFNNPGPANKDMVPDVNLLTAVLEEIGKQKEQIADQRGTYCGAPTYMDTVQLTTVGMTFENDGQGEGGDESHNLQHLPSYEITLGNPSRRVIRTGITQAAVERGITSNTITSNAREMMQAYRRDVMNCITTAKFAVGQWYDGSLTPPPYGGKTFAADHTHYLAYDVDSLITVAIVVDAKHHISEHGYDESGVYCEMCGDDIARIEKLGELVQNDQSIFSDIIQRLQGQGFYTGFTLSGVPIMRNDYIPADYAFFGTVERPPMAWKRLQPPGDDGTLNTYQNVIIPNVDMAWIGEASHWAVIPDVVELGAGCAVWLNDAQTSGVYSAPTPRIVLA